MTIDEQIVEFAQMGCIYRAEYPCRETLYQKPKSGSQMITFFQNTTGVNYV